MNESKSKACSSEQCNKSEETTTTDNNTCCDSDTCHHNHDDNFEFENCTEECCDEDENIKPYLLMDEVNQCSISNWYYLYDGKTNPHITPKRITIMSKLIYLND